MRLRDNPAFRPELSSHDIRSITARLAHPEDPLAEWKFEFGEWRKAYSEFQEFEQEKLVRVDAPPAVILRQHRYLLFLLLTQGEGLALALEQEPHLSDAERELLEQVDAFIGTLTDSWHTWHGQALPEHRQALAKFLA